jgi:hypothetical protein
VQPPAALPGDEPDAAPVHQQGSGEQQRLGRSPQQHPRHQQGRAHQQRPPGDGELMAQPTVTGRCHRVQGEVDAADHQVGAHQHQRPIQTAWPVLPGLRNGQGDDKDRRHGHGHAHPQDTLINPCLVPQPGVGRPGPPQQRQQQPLHHAVAAVLVGHVAGDLGGGKHIDQVGEQLEGRHPMVLTGGTNASQDPAAPPHLALLNHGRHLSSVTEPCSRRLCPHDQPVNPPASTRR